MGFFNLFKKRKKVDHGIDITMPSDIKNDPRKVVRLNTNTERIAYIKDNCELILESERQMEEAKAEYQAVTSYLTDMQKIDMIPLEQRGTLEDAARNIYNLTQERNKLQGRNALITDKQYRLFEHYELALYKEMPTIKENEKYQVMIQQDIAHLEKERQDLNGEEEDIIHKQGFLKGIAITISIIISVLFLLFAIMSNYSEISMSFPFLLTVFMGMALALYIFLEARKNIADIRQIQMKQNRQIMLMNKVKIKSVNNRNYLEYAYNKYMVESYEQLRVYWEEYLRLKDEAKRYKKNTDLMEFYHNQLIKELKKFGISDAEIWIFQTSAILDNKEMIEVRHRLNVRRQKLRERIEVNSKQKEEALKSVQNTIQTYPDCETDAGQLLRRYRINLE